MQAKIVTCAGVPCSYMTAQAVNPGQAFPATFGGAQALYGSGFKSLGQA